MTQKWYLRDTIAATSPTAGEKSTTEPVAGQTFGLSPAELTLSGTKGTTATSGAVTLPNSTSANNGILGIRRWCSPPLAAGTYGSGTWTIALQSTESNANYNMFHRSASIYFWRPGTSSVVGFVIDSNTQTGVELGNGVAAARYGQVISWTGSNVTIQDGDILVFEPWIGGTPSMGAAGVTATIYYDGTTDVTAAYSGTDPASYINAPADIPIYVNPNATGTIVPVAATVTRNALAGGASGKLRSMGAQWLGVWLGINDTTNAMITTPDAAALRLTGAIDIRSKTIIDWADTRIDIGKWGIGLRSWLLCGNGGLANIRPAMARSTNGSDVLATQSNGGITNAAAGFPKGLSKWERCVFTPNDGAGNRTYKFYHSDDGTNWTQHGTTVTTSGAITLQQNAGAMVIGPGTLSGASVSPGYGIFQWMEIRDGDGGTIVASLDAENDTFNAAGQLTDAQGNVWTLAGGAEQIPTGAVVTDPLLAAGVAKQLTTVTPIVTPVQLVAAAPDATGTPVTVLPVVTPNQLVGGSIVNATGIVAPFGWGDGVRPTTLVPVTVDRPSFNVGQHLDVRILLAMDDWTPAAQAVLRQSGSAPDAGWMFNVNAAGTLTFQWSTDGTTLFTHTSSVNPAFANGSTNWIRAVWDGDDGSGNRTTKFYRSTNYDPDLDTGSWTQIGTTQTTAGTHTMFDSTADLAFGSSLSAHTLFAMQLRSSDNGPIIASPDFRESSLRRFGTGVYDAQGNVWQLGAATQRVRQSVFVQQLIDASDHVGVPVTKVLTVHPQRLLQEAWEPPSLIGLQAWYDASDVSTITDAGAGAVSAWADKSGKGGRDLAQATAGNRPTTGTRTLDGKNVVDFDGTTDRLDSTGWTQNQAYTIFAVAVNDAGGDATKRMIVTGTSAFGGILQKIAAGTWEMFAGTALAGPAITDTGAHLLTGVFTGGSSRFRVDGVQATGNAGTAALNGIRLGCSSLTADFWDGPIAEIIVYAGALSASDVSKVESYLTKKWLGGGFGIVVPVLALATLPALVGVGGATVSPITTTPIVTDPFLLGGASAAVQSALPTVTRSQLAGAAGGSLVTTLPLVTRNALGGGVGSAVVTTLPTVVRNTLGANVGGTVVTALPIVTRNLLTAGSNASGSVVTTLPTVVRNVLTGNVGGVVTVQVVTAFPVQLSSPVDATGTVQTEPEIVVRNVLAGGAGGMLTVALSTIFPSTLAGAVNATASPATIPVRSGGSAGAISHDATSQADGVAGTASKTFAHTVGAGADRLLIVSVGAEINGTGLTPVTGITYNGVALTFVDAIETSEASVERGEIWYLLDPPVGTANVVVTCSGAVPSGWTAQATSLFGVAQGPPEATAKTQTGTDSIAYSSTITTLTPGAWVYDVIVGGTGVTDFTPDAGQVKRSFLQTGGAVNDVGSSTKEVASPGSTTLGWTATGSEFRWLQVLAAWAPAAGGGTNKLDGGITVSPATRVVDVFAQMPTVPVHATGTVVPVVVPPVGIPPDQITGLAGWYDFADTTTLTDAGGGAVSDVADKSGNARTLTQTNAVNRPTTGTRTQNGLNVLDFNGDHLNSAAFALAQPFTVFGVGLMDSVGVGRRLFAAITTTLQLGITTTQWLINAGTAVAAGTPDTAAHVWTAAFDATSSLRIDGNAIVSGNAGTNGVTVGWRIGLGPTGAQNWDGWIGEIVVFDRVLSAAERAGVEAYLGEKWGVTVAGGGAGDPVAISTLVGGAGGSLVAVPSAVFPEILTGVAGGTPATGIPVTAVIPASVQQLLGGLTQAIVTALPTVTRNVLGAKADVTVSPITALPLVVRNLLGGGITTGLVTTLPIVTRNLLGGNVGGSLVSVPVTTVRNVLGANAGGGLVTALPTVVRNLLLGGSANPLTTRVVTVVPSNVMFSAAGLVSTRVVTVVMQAITSSAVATPIPVPVIVTRNVLLGGAGGVPVPALVMVSVNPLSAGGNVTIAVVPVQSIVTMQQLRGGISTAVQTTARAAVMQQLLGGAGGMLATTQAPVNSNVLAAGGGSSGVVVPVPVVVSMQTLTGTAGATGGLVTQVVTVTAQQLTAGAGGNAALVTRQVVVISNVLTGTGGTSSTGTIATRQAIVAMSTLLAGAGGMPVTRPVPVVAQQLLAGAGGILLTKQIVVTVLPGQATSAAAALAALISATRWNLFDVVIVESTAGFTVGSAHFDPFVLHTTEEGWFAVGSKHSGPVEVAGDDDE